MQNQGNPVPGPWSSGAAWLKSETSASPARFTHITHHPTSHTTQQERSLHSVILGLVLRIHTHSHTTSAISSLHLEPTWNPNEQVCSLWSAAQGSHLSLWRSSPLSHYRSPVPLSCHCLARHTRGRAAAWQVQNETLAGSTECPLLGDSWPRGLDARDGHVSWAIPLIRWLANISSVPPKPQGLGNLPGLSPEG